MSPLGAKHLVFPEEKSPLIQGLGLGEGPLISLVAVDPVGEDGDVADRRSLMDPKPDVIGLQKGPQMLRQRLNIHLPPGGDHQQDTLGIVVVQHGHLA